MNRKRFTTVILIVLLTILPIISVMMMYHISLCDTMSQMDSGCYGDNNILYKVAENATASTMIENIEKLDDRVALYQEQEINGVTIKAIYFNKYYINFPMKTGRFFRKSDLIEGNKVAVIGKNLETYTYKREKNTYILVQEEEYKVVGVIDFGEETLIDNCLYINMFESDNLMEGSLYTLDIWGKDSHEGEIFTKLLQEDGLECKELSRMDYYGMVIIPQLLYGRWFIGLFLCVLLCISIVSIQWIKLQKQEIAIRRLVGGSVVAITTQLTGKYLCYVLISLIISMIFCLAKFSGYLHSLTVGYVIAIPILLFILIVNILGATRTPLAEAIR